MKNRISLLGIITILAIIGFGFAACGGDDNKGGNNNIEMVQIPAGTFTMGTVSGGGTDERPVRQVTLSC